MGVKGVMAGGRASIVKELQETKRQARRNILCLVVPYCVAPYCVVPYCQFQLLGEQPLTSLVNFSVAVKFLTRFRHIQSPHSIATLSRYIQSPDSVVFLAVFLNLFYAL